MRILDYPEMGEIDNDWFILVDDSGGSGTAIINLCNFTVSQINSMQHYLLDAIDPSWFYTFEMSMIYDEPNHYGVYLIDTNPDLNTEEIAKTFIASPSKLVELAFLQMESEIFSKMAKQYTETAYPENRNDTVIYLGSENEGFGNGKIIQQPVDEFGPYLFDKGKEPAQYKFTTFNPIYLGSSVSQQQWDAIEDGSFEGLWLGAYWVKNDILWRIVDFDYWYNIGIGDDPQINHHVTIMPDYILYNSKMNETDINSGGYKGSWLRSNGLTSAINTINDMFGPTHIYEHQEYMSNAVSDGIVTGNMWTLTSGIEIPSQEMFYGFKPSGGNSVNNWSGELRKLRAFDVDPRLLTLNRCNYWFRNISGNDRFVYFSKNGVITTALASSTWVGVRPIFSICKQNSRDDDMSSS